MEQLLVNSHDFELNHDIKHLSRHGPNNHNNHRDRNRNINHLPFSPHINHHPNPLHPLLTIPHHRPHHLHRNSKGFNRYSYTNTPNPRTLNNSPNRLLRLNNNNHHIATSNGDIETKCVVLWCSWVAEWGLVYWVL